MLAEIDFNQAVTKKNINKQLPFLNEQIYCLQKASWDAHLPVIILLEGWETVRKGRLIRTLAEPLDPRGFIFHAIRSPLPHEKARPWMWRYWMKTPERGQWAIFDQSWYRRVLLEPLKNKLSERELRRAFRDINDFERTLSDDGTLILKFFLHTQKSQFTLDAGQAAREVDVRSTGPANPKTLSRRYDQLLEIYETALRHTSQDWAPWAIIPSDDKHTARHILITTIVSRLQQRLGLDCMPVRAETTPPAPASKPRAPRRKKTRPPATSSPIPKANQIHSDESPQPQASGADVSGAEAPLPEAEAPKQPPTKADHSPPDETPIPDRDTNEAAHVPPGDELP